MSKPKRNPDGTFPKGVSGNLAGRPKKVKPRHRMPAHNRHVVFEVAETPVTVKMGGEAVETSVYHGVMMALAKKAMEGHTPSIRLFLHHLDNSAAVHGQMNELTQWLFEEHKKMQDEIDQLRALFPKVEGGVMIEQPDGSVVPAAWVNSVRSLPAPEERE